MKNDKWNINAGLKTFLLCAAIAVIPLTGGCMEGYSNQSLYPQQIKTVSVQMFDNQSFYRGVEFELTDALAKRIEAETPYKIITNQNTADSVITGYISNIDDSVLSIERQTGRSMEKDVEFKAVVNWKDLKTGKLLMDNMQVTASASYSNWQKQGFQYGSALAANNLADRIVELMEKKW
jgi:hypothetical protein